MGDSHGDLQFRIYIRYIRRATMQHALANVLLGCVLITIVVCWQFAVHFAKTAPHSNYMSHAQVTTRVADSASVDAAITSRFPPVLSCRRRCRATIADILRVAARTP